MKIMPMRTFLPSNSSLSGAGRLLIVSTLLLVVIGLFFPLYDYSQVRRDIAAAEQRLLELEVLHPLYVELTKSNLSERWDLPRPEKKKLAHEEVLDVPSLFAELVRGAGMELGEVKPRVAASREGVRQLHVDLQLSGPYHRLRDVLMSIMAMPAMERIDRVSIVREADHEAYQFSLWLGLE